MRRVHLFLIGIGVALTAAALWGKHALDSYEPSEYLGPNLPPPTRVPHVGDTLTPIALRDLTGKSVTVAGKSEHRTLVHFWASWCLPCVAELPSFEQSRPQFLAKHVDLITVALDDRSHAQEIVDRFHLTMPVLISDGAAVDPIMSLGSGQGAVPYNALLDESGRLIAQKVGTAEAGAAGIIKWLDSL